MHEMRICYAARCFRHWFWGESPWGQCPGSKLGKEQITQEEFILFGKYRVISVLGTGSFSTVYLAEHLRLKAYRAIKRIPKDTAAGPSLQEQDGFLLEASLLKDLSHPGIPLIYDIDEDDAYIYMTEEYIQGESLDKFLSHQESISQELVIQFGIQLCEILDYLHHLLPRPILYQDLKPEHIILCGNQLKLIDFGVASYFTGSGRHFQIYGTEGFAAPEALKGLPTTAQADIYSLGKVLGLLARHASPPCHPKLARIIAQATADGPAERYLSASALKAALAGVPGNACGRSSHLIRNIAVIGCRAGAGATHFSIALVSTLNKLGLSSFYMPSDGTDTLAAIARANQHVKEQQGIYYYGYFRGIPDYGPGVDFPVPEGCCLIRDYGNRPPDVRESIDLIFYVVSGSDWDMAQALSFYGKLPTPSQVNTICNYHNSSAARTYARHFGNQVYCFPCDPDPYRVTAEKERLISAIFHIERRKKAFFSLKGEVQNPVWPSES